MQNLTNDVPQVLPSTPELKPDVEDVDVLVVDQATVRRLMPADCTTDDCDCDCVGGD